MDKVNSELPNSQGVARYFDVDEDNASQDIVLIMEYLKSHTLKQHIESYGIFELNSIKFIIYDIIQILKQLSRIGEYHGRLNISNIHVDELKRVKLTDYCFMSIIDSESDFSCEEGSRLDIF